MNQTMLTNETWNQLIIARKEVNHTMYWITGFLGMVLLVAPYMFNYADNMPALWTSLILGALVLAISLAEGYLKDTGKWEYWTAAFLGLAAILAPFVFGFGNYAIAMWTTVIMGTLITVFAGTKLYGGT